MQRGAQYGAPTAVCWAGSVVASRENAQLFLWTPRNPPDPSQDSVALACAALTVWHFP